MPATRFFPFLMAACLGAAHAQGGSAVITLVMPPPGGEGFTALQSGAALAEGATAVYYNPAALAELERSTGHAVAATMSRQELLPLLGLPDLWSRFSAAGLTLPDREGGTDLGIGILQSVTNFGKNYVTDDRGESVRVSENWETVYGIALGIRLGMPLSLGVSAKFIDSRLTAGSSADGDAIARGWAFDLSALYMPRYRIADLPFEITPSFALVAANLGPDVFYDEAFRADPIPTTCTVAAAVTFDLGDALRITDEVQVDQEFTRNTRKWSPIFNIGESFLIAIVRMGMARLWDPVGKRNEFHRTVALEFDYTRLRRLGGRLGWFKWPEFRFEPRLTAGRRSIESLDEGIRDGQSAWFIGVGL